MADADPRPAQPLDLARIEVDPVRDPGAGREPARLFQKIDRAHAERLDAVNVLVERLAEMRVQPAIVALGESRRSFHHPLRHGERRAGGERDADHRAGFWIVKQPQHALAVFEDGLRVLHDRVRLKTAVLLGNAHRSARDRHPQAELYRLLDFDVDGAFQARSEQIVMVSGGRAAGEQEFDERHPDRDAKRLGGHAAPDALHGDQPGDELLADPIGVGAGQRLVEMMMRVDEARQHDVARGVERDVPRSVRRLAASDAFDDPRSLDDDAALGARRRENRERVLDP